MYTKNQISKILYNKDSNTVCTFISILYLIYTSFNMAKLYKWYYLNSKSAMIKSEFFLHVYFRLDKGSIQKK